MNQYTFISRVRSILNDNAGKRWLPAQRYGPRLDEPRLALVEAGSTRVFARPLERQFKDYHVALFVDTSGSMEGNPMQQATVAAHAVHYGLEVAGCATVQTFGFSNNVYDVSQCARYDVRKLYKVLREGRKGGGTDDFKAVKKGIELLGNRSGGKIIVMITDGGSGDMESLHAQVLQARELGIKVMGLGIYVDEVVEAYGPPNSCVIQNDEGIYDGLMHLLEKEYHRG